MKKALALSAIIVVAIASFAVLFANYTLPKSKEKNPEIFVGVTYGGDSVSDGKLLIDKVKDYSNLFVLQSGALQRDFKSVNELGEYAIAKGLYFLPYFGMVIQPQFSEWLSNATQRWGTRLLGVYYGDEPGGKMLDSYVTFNDSQTGDSITKTTYGDILVQKPNGSKIFYEIGGNIHLLEPMSYTYENASARIESASTYVTFYPNGTVAATYPNPTTLTNEIVLNYKPTTTYKNLMNIKPFKDANDIANKFCTNDQGNIQTLRNSTKLFTSDYALYWFDYQAGYDVVLTRNWMEQFTGAANRIRTRSSQTPKQRLGHNHYMEI